MLSLRRLTPLAALVLLAGFAAPSQASDHPATLSAHSKKVSWQGTLDQPTPFGCDQPAFACDVTELVVEAAEGAWVTVEVDDQSAHVSVTTSGQLVGSNGQQQDVNPGRKQQPKTTFQQVSSGRVTYQVAVGDEAASPATPFSYTATARLAGDAFDRAGDCGATSGLEELNASTDGKIRHPLAVRLVADPKDAATVRQAGKTVVEIYARIGVPVVVSYDFRALPPYKTYPYEGVRAAYGGVRPPGIDVVHVMTDDFAGGIADCIGGIAYPEKAFSVGNVHYTVQGTVPVSQVPAGMVAAHEIGHLLGAQHQQSNCAEAAPQEAAQPASDGWTGPCTIMGPAALQDSETFSTLERNTIRYFAATYAGRR